MNKKFIGLIIVLIVGVSIMAVNTYLQKEKLNKNGVISKAVIEDIRWNKYENEIGTPVDNIHIQYKYQVGDKEIIKTQEILRHEHDLYFDTTKNVGDSVKIKYLEKSPNHSRIEKRTNMSD
ncbi:DUF3592 domain-containing protein [Aquimarina sp. 2201CG5-10]|uniref:DUF3592 domain-containing protein n=1 Tax=Aquimarina callyspongiae TaxID=3098150 RepID=UPI002AB4DABD|nr:DUF3592 domain-containing protein [Aquimarina sp. 2201CG5-10]MDY8136768.1 hypothetical protein [Aquimarina sp. 2201CG5-10]